MFLKTNRLIKLIRDAYRTNLNVGNYENNLILQGGSWAVCMDLEHAPKKVKGLITELAGYIPKEGEFFNISRKQSGAEVIIEKASLEGIATQADKAEELLMMTPLSIDFYGKHRLVQELKTRKMFGINEEIVNMIDIEEVNIDIESEPTGPVCDESYEKGVYWFNDLCILKAMPTILQENTIKGVLETIDFSIGE